MPNPHIDQVRQALLATLSDLRNRDNPMDIERAKAVATVASVLVDTAKVENEYLRITGQDSSGFLASPVEQAPSLRVVGPTANNPFPVSVRHTLGE